MPIILDDDRLEDRDTKDAGRGASRSANISDGLRFERRTGSKLKNTVRSALHFADFSGRLKGWSGFKHRYSMNPRLSTGRCTPDAEGLALAY